MALSGAGVAAYKFANKSYDVIKAATKARPAKEVYAAEFGTSANDCVQIIGYSDVSIPTVDDQLLLCFRACPAEVARILSMRNYEVVDRALADVVAKGDRECCRDYFSRERFGSMVMECMDATDGNVYTAYISKDSTHGLYVNARK